MDVAVLIIAIALVVAMSVIRRRRPRLSAVRRLIVV
jgi:hypothetical protein